MQFKPITDKQEWENFVSKTEVRTSFLQSWNWGEFQKELGNKVLRYGIFENEALVGVMSMVKKIAKRGRMLHVRHGPVFDISNFERTQELVQFLKQVGKQENVWHIRISPLVKPNEVEEKNLFKLGFKDCQMHDVDAEITWVLDLDKDNEELLQNMRKNTRYAINKARKLGVTIEKTKDINKIDEFWTIFQDTVKRQQWVAYSLDYIKKQFEIFVKDNQMQLFLAKYEGKYIAASLFTYYKDQVVYHHSGSLTEYQKIPAASLLQWESIQEAKKRGFKKYNFWGISPLDENGELERNHPWYGLSLFKKGFGGRMEQWTHAKDLPIKPQYWLTHYFELLERKRKGF